MIGEDISLGFGGYKINGNIYYFLTDYNATSSKTRLNSRSGYVNSVSLFDDETGNISYRASFDTYSFKKGYISVGKFNDYSILYDYSNDKIIYKSSDGFLGLMGLEYYDLGYYSFGGILFDNKMNLLFGDGKIKSRLIEYNGYLIYSTVDGKDENGNDMYKIEYYDFKNKKKVDDIFDRTLSLCYSSSLFAIDNNNLILIMNGKKENILSCNDGKTNCTDIVSGSIGCQAYAYYFKIGEQTKVYSYNDKTIKNDSTY